MKILDKIFKKKELTKEVATSSLTGLRRVWNDDSVARGLTPIKLAQIFDAANMGDHHQYLTLAEEMEEREPHYGSVLGTRKRAVAGLDIKVRNATEDKKDVDIADSVRALVDAAEFGELLDDLLDGLGKGYSVCEIDWSKGKQWIPKKYVFRDPRFFQFSRDDDQTLRLVDEEDMINGLKLPEYKFIIHRPKLKSGIPSRGGLARLVAVSYMCKSFALTDWMAFIEVFGVPIRIGKYGNDAKDDDITALKSAVANIGSNAAAIMPESMQIEFIEAAQSRGGESLFENLATWLDKQISKAVLGQTMTADDGSSNAQAGIHNEVRIDILRADAKALANTLNRDLVKPFVDLNFGVQEVYPTISLLIPEAEDLALLSDSIAKLIPHGLKVSQSEIRNKFGLSEPDDDDILQVNQVNSAENNSCTHCNKALNNEKRDIGFDELSDWEEVIKPMLNPIETLLNDCQDLAEFEARLPELLQTQDPKQLIKLLTKSAFKAKVEGLSDD